MDAKETKRLKLRQVSKSLESHELFAAGEIGKRIAILREAIGMSQRQLAKRIGISQQALNKIENKGWSSSIETLERILKALKVNLYFSMASEESLEQKVTKRAFEKAEKMVDRTEAGMAMELQQPDREGRKERVKQLAERLASAPGRSLWEDI